MQDSNRPLDAEDGLPDAATASAPTDAVEAHSGQIDGPDLGNLPPHARTIRSYVMRAGRTTEAQAKALAELGPRFLMPYQEQLLDFPATFGRTAPVVLEIGFGMGDATAKIAEGQPDTDYIGCEVHEPGVGALLKQIGDRGLSNLRVIRHDAVMVLENMIPPGSLAGIHIFFPDPWHKKRHNKRRLIQSPLVAKLVTHLAPGGYLHCATDWEPYAQQMLEVLGAEPTLVNTAEGYAEKPAYRPLTKFENRGLKLGHGVWDLVFRKKA
ncbi:MAG: tRNA (guanosine(46)-N7)-methyltransferase TrmB [Aquabacterium sp.]|uniref:tRNA (guanosine(46)-N7)-methyltransferase TrmB n=1 Tax=Aquabacterium sp. TaxID=1872578 RepID=UPI0011F45209|nr:tRNA (guanosine(46)-N7)-methyltransferase TrmB [Aquabacterium sp.]TAK97149.1 MAG: tRNA (guanosine(46)-N7)-methyltransferase TrmB [Aquabacterium sp.]